MTSPMTLPTSPITPNQSMAVDSTSAGANSRRTPSTATNPPTASSTEAWAAAATISARLYPQVRLSVAGRSARVAAVRAMSSPAESVNMCPASASNARLPEITAPMISATMIVAVMAKTTASFPRRPVPAWE